VKCIQLSRRKSKKKLLSISFVLKKEMSAEPLNVKKRKVDGVAYTRTGSKWKECRCVLGEKSMSFKRADGKALDRVWFADIKAVKVVVAGGTRPSSFAETHLFSLDITGGATVTVASQSAEIRDKFVNTVVKRYRLQKSTD
jgi:hypothetical protein